MSVLDDWRLWANCYGMDPEVFYPDRGDKVDSEVDRVCVTCPVRFACLHSSMGEEFGTWGGLAREIRATIRRWDNRECPQCAAPVAKAAPVLFCSDECLETATFSDDDNYLRIVEELARLDERASRVIRLRKPRDTVAA